MPTAAERQCLLVNEKLLRRFLQGRVASVPVKCSTERHRRETAAKGDDEAQDNEKDEKTAVAAKTTAA